MPIQASKLSRPKFGLNRERNGLPKVKEYTKNVVKSIAFASVDAIKHDAPGISDFLSTNNDAFKEAYNSVVDYKSSIKKVNRSIKNSKVYEALDYGMHNLLEDLKSGNFYNTTRSSMDSMFSIDEDFDDMDMDFNFDDDTGSSSVKSSSSSDKFEASMAAAATTQATAVAMSANYVIGANKQSTKLMLGQMDKISTSITAGFGTMYNSIGVVNKFLAGPMQTHLENSRRYYEETTRMMQEQNAMLKELLEMQRNLYKKPVDRYKGINNTFDDIAGSGTVDLAAYGKNIVKNFKRTLDNLGISMFGGNKSDGNGNMLKMMFDNPLGMILPGIIDGMLSKEFKTSLKSFDKGISSLFSQFVAEMDKYKNEFSIKGLLANIFGVQTNTKRSINTGKYEKGPVPFDGVTRTAIVETIPGYLARIEKALTGRDDSIHYDYQRGQWTSERKIQKNLEQRKYDYMDRGTSGIRDDTRELINQLAQVNKEAAEKMQAQVDHMREVIFNDKGRFKYEGKVNGKDAYDYYGFGSKKDFDKIVSAIKKDTIRDLASRNIKANNDYGNFFTQQENEGGGIYRQIYNKGDDIKKIMDGGSGILAASADRMGKNVFSYLSDILDEIRSIGGKKKGRYNAPKSKNNNRRRTSTNSASSEQNDSSSNEEPPQGASTNDADMWEAAEANNRKEDEEQEQEGKLGQIVNNLFGQTKLGKALNNFGGLIGNIIRAPMSLATKLLDKADKNLFKMMFGDNKDLRDKDGNKINNLFDYAVYKVNDAFDKIKEKISNIFDPIKEKLKNIFDPIFNKTKEILKKGKERLGKSLDNTFGKAARAAANTKAGKKFTGTKFGQAVVQNVMSAEDAENILNNNATTDNSNPTDGINTSAMGRLVTKRGLTMISPGEVIIPASFDKKVQKKQLAAEKRDRARIIKAIGLNAEGTVDTDKIKAKLNQFMSSLGNGKGEAIWNDAKANGSTIGAGGLLGLGGSILAGFNPILGAAVGAGISMISTSDTFKKIVLGDTDENGERQGGVVPKSVIKFFKKYSGDMLDFGVAGGILGLFGPFGVLGGAAMGAGIGFLKNNETFKKFIFGTDDEEGLISKDTQKKFTEFAKKSAPNVAIGAVAGALLGPFGILGNAAMGAGLGMLSSTNTFHKFLFGDKDEGTDGIMGAFKRGVLEPAMNIVKDIKKKFDGYLKKNILDPLKNFGKVMGQEVKNVIMNVGDKISDHIRDSYEKNIGLPMRDFIQERLFKPLTKLFGGALKGLLGVGGKAVAAPFSIMNWIANNTRAKQIKRGQAYDMTAQERNEWRANHKGRMRFGDKTKESDEAMAAMSDEDVSNVAGLLKAYGKGSDELVANLGASKKNLSNAMSNSFNADLRNTIGVGTMDKLAKAASSGDWDQFETMVTKNKKLSDDQKKKLLKEMKPHVSAVAEAQEGAKFSDKSDDEIAQMLEKLTGRKFKKNDHKAIRAAMRDYSAEDKNRKKHKKGAEEITDSAGNPLEGGEEVIARTTQAINEAVNNHSKTIIDKLSTINANLDKMLGKDAEPAKPNPVEEAANSMNSSGISDILNSDNNPTSPAPAPATTGEGTEGSRALQEAKEKEEEEEKDQVQRDQLNEQKETTSIWKKMYNKLFGKGEDNDDRKRKHGFFGALSNGFAGVLGALGVGTSKIGKILGTGAKVVIGLSLLGHFSGFLKSKVLPVVSKLLFGTEKEDGTRQGGLLGPVINWVKDPNGMQAFISDKLIPWITSGFGLVVTNLITPLTAAAVKSLPSIAWALVKGVWQGIKSIIKGDGNVPNSTNSMNDAISGSNDELKDASKTMSTYSSSLASGVPESITKKFKTSININGISNGKFTAADGSDVDLDDYEVGDTIKGGFEKSIVDSNGNTVPSTTTKNKDVEYEVVESAVGKRLRNKNGWSDNVKTVTDPLSNRTYTVGAFGRLTPTGKIMYTADGTPITDIARGDGVEETLTSAAAKGGKRAFINALTGSGGAGLFNLFPNISGKGTGKGLVKLVTGTGSKILKGFSNVAQTFTGLGKAARAQITGGDAKEAFMDSISNKNLKGVYNFIQHPIQGLKNGFNSVKDNIANSFIGTGINAIKNHTLKETIANGAKGLLNNAKNGITNWFDNSLIGKGVKFVTGNSNKAMDKVLGKKSLLDKAKDIGSAVKSKVGDMWSDLKNVPSTLKDAFGKKGAKAAAGAAGDVAEDVVQDTASKALSIASDAAGDVSEKAIKEGVTNTMEGLAPTILQKVAKFLTKSIGETAITKAMKEIGEKLCKNMFTKLAGKALKSVATALESIPIIGIAMIVIDFIYGYDNAETILGVTKDNTAFKVNFGHRVLCGLLNVINERITLGLIPLEVIIDIVVDILFPVLGIDAKGLKEARSQTEDIINKYNEEHPEDTVDNLKDYNNKDKWYYKAGKAVKKAFKNTVSDVAAWFKGESKPKDAESGGGGSGTSGKIDIQTNAAGGLVTKGGLSMVSAGETIINSQSALSGILGNLLSSPLGFMQDAFTGVKNNITSVISKFKNAKNAVNVSDKKIDNAVQTGDDIDIFSKDYWTIKSDSSQDGVLGTLSDIQSYLNRVINAPLLMVKNVGGKFLETLDASKGLLKDRYSSAWDWVKSFFGGGKGRMKATSTGTRKKSLWNKLFGKARHEYQDDPSISNMKYGDSTIGEAGCGPVAAANLINNMKNSKKKMSVGKAAKYAEDHNMTVEGGGTDLGYFKSILNSQGIPSKTTSSKQDVMQSLKNGEQVVMLGKDKNGGKGSPFGNDYHYVTAKGLDRNGNILAEDPDLPQSTVKYNSKKMLNSMISSVATKKNKRGGKGRLFGRKLITHLDTIDGVDPNESVSTKKKSPYPAGSELLNNFPYFCQYDDAWKDHGYGKGTILSSGCGPTSTSMILRSYGVPVTPIDVADFSVAHGDRVDCGTAHQLFFDAANAYGLNCNAVGTDLGAIKNNLSKGIPLIASGTGNRPYTTSGHIVTFIGLDQNGNIIVNDPVSRDRSIPYTDDALRSGLANTFAISAADGKGSINGAGGRVANPNSGAISASGSYSSGSYSSSSSFSSSDSSSGTTSNFFTALTNLGKSIMKAMFGKDAFNALFGDSDDSSDSSSSGSTNYINTSTIGSVPTTSSSNGNTKINPKALTGKNNEEKIWNALRSAGLTPIAASGIIGNWMHESGLISNNLENMWEHPASYYGDSGTWPGYTDQTYTDFVDKNGKWPEYGQSGYNDYLKKHMNDMKNYVGYGLAQWTHSAYKDALLAMAKNNGMSIGDAGLQAAFLLDTIKTNSASTFNRLNGYKTPKDAAVDFFKNYEYGGGDVEGREDLGYSKRIDYATQFYEKYKDLQPGVTDKAEATEKSAEVENAKTSNKDVTIDNNKVPDEETLQAMKESLKNPTIDRNYNPIQATNNMMQQVAGRGRDDATGTATNALNNLSNYSDGTTGPIMASNNTSGSVSYDQFLKTIVEILSSIAGNTAILSKILEILSDKFGLNISSDDVTNAVASNKAKARDALSQLVSRSSNNNVNVSNILNTKDTSYILNAMAAVATE